jgi:succinate dehydrogenase/fumarate reductase flavoprotein subunit
MLYENTDNSIDLTGDGYALALDAGLALRDMEFVQFYPIGLLFPPALKGMLGGLLYYCRLYNANGERFMARYDPERLELSMRDRVSRAIMQEVREGRGTPMGGVYMDLTFNAPGFIAKMTPALYTTYRNIGIDPEKDRIEVAPTVHFFMGGLDVDADWTTALPGLFGSGEVCGGMHGGNRLSQNALAEILVSGEISGRNAAQFAARAPKRPIDPGVLRHEEELVAGLLAGERGMAPSARRAELRRLMWEDVGVFRDEQSLLRARRTVEGWLDEPVVIAQKNRYMNFSVLEALENRNLMQVALCVILSALSRRESRAAHYRSDYPKTDSEHFLKNTLVRQHGGAFAVESRPVRFDCLRPGEGR